MDKLIKSFKLVSATENSSLLLGNSIFLVQFASITESSQKEMNDLALKERLAQVDLRNCEVKIREKNNIPDSRILILHKTHYDRLINLDKTQNDLSSNYLSFSFYDPEYDLKFSSKVCNDTQVSLKFHLSR